MNFVFTRAILAGIGNWRCDLWPLELQEPVEDVLVVDVVLRIAGSEQRQLKGIDVDEMAASGEDRELVRDGWGAGVN